MDHIAKMSFFEEGFDTLQATLKETLKYEKSLTKARGILRSIAECLESKTLGKIYDRLGIVANVVSEENAKLNKAQKALEAIDRKLHDRLVKGHTLTLRDLSEYAKVRAHLSEDENIIYDTWDSLPASDIRPDLSELDILRSRPVKEYQRLVTPSIRYNDLEDSLYDPPTILEMYNEYLAEQGSTRTATRTKPSFPLLRDTREPTNEDLWKDVLDVASGNRRELRVSDRIIHSPNRGRGYRRMPSNPKGIAWAIKQYNGFGGKWRERKSENRLPHEPDDELVRRVLKRYQEHKQ